MTLELERQDSSISGQLLRQTPFGIFTFGRIPIDGVQASSISSQKLNVLCDQGPSGLPLWKSSLASQEKDKETIDAFILDTSQQHLSIKHNEHYAWSNIAAYMCLLLALLTLLLPVIRGGETAIGQEHVEKHGSTGE